MKQFGALSTKIVNGNLRYNQGSTDMTELIDVLGPVDWLLVEFPGSRFNGQIAPALLDLVERDLIRVLDLLVLKKDTDGSLVAFELSDLDEGEIGELRTYESELAMLLSEEDVTSLAAAIEPGSSAAVFGLGEHLGGTVRLCCASVGRSAGGQWSHPDSGAARRHRS
jgi:hypothetical protein